jgi:tRNA (cytidine/uridine-2'-O-)-methyltransferase
MNKFSIVLFEPEIPPNTGNIARLCAGTDTPLHLIEPLGFSLSDKYLKRAGLDYWPNVNLTVWKNWEQFRQNGPDGRLVFTSAKRGTNIFKFKFEAGDLIVFGPETRGLPIEFFTDDSSSINIPINKKIRSLNLSTSAGIALYQAMSQLFS